MKTLNKTASRIFGTLIQKMGTSDHLKLNNGGESIMPVIIERLYKEIDFNGRPGDVYSLSHYYQQNGDLVPDPDMTFVVITPDASTPETSVTERSRGVEVIPLTFQNSMYYTEAIFQSGGKWRISHTEQHDLAYFANMWLKNLKWQQNL